MICPTPGTTTRRACQARNRRWHRVAEGLTGRCDPEVLAAAVEENRMVFTLGRGFGNIRTYPPGSHSGIVVFRLDDQSAHAVIAT
ncbi:DUF5615 family PIN-like protein [Frankia gtarii]|uniref:DUF5615 family PIN-like protein n=1 Tax=Frankia gtarii TaxID=2950102 RepID=UPI0034D54FBB